MSLDAKVVLPLRCKLGEGLHWDARRNLLWFVDIHGQHVYWFDPDTLQLGMRIVPEPVGWVLSIENSGRVLVGLKSGIGLLDPFSESAGIEWVDRRFPSDAGIRLNDAKADDRGRLWYGSVSADDESKSVGCLARYEPTRGDLAIVDTGYRVANGPAFSPDCAIMLHNDSARRLTYRYSVDAATGQLTSRRIWKEFSEGDGYPDGMNFDAEGCVWIAHWGSGRLCRYNVHAQLMLTIKLPTSNITNVCFGGRDLKRLFVTSARQGLSEAQTKAEVDAGALFEIMDVGVLGLMSRQIRM